MNEFWTIGHKVELEEMLAGREHRAKVQRQMLDFCSDASLICFTLNIAGPMKVTALTDEAFYAGASAIVQILHRAGIDAEAEVFEYPYGHEAYFVIDESNQSAEDIKRLTILLEEEHPLGRLFDIDVIASDGHKISRTDVGFEPRKCMLCDSLASECASTRRHSVDELTGFTNKLIETYLRNGDEFHSATISRMAYNSMMNELATTPKPGLVDLDNNGSHKDLTPEIFEQSAQAIKNYFGDIFEMGYAMQSDKPEDILQKVRHLGIATEEQMFHATEGVNTHKGMIFSLGLVCLAWGYCFQNKHEAETVENILKVASEIAKPAADEATRTTRGGGARKEAVSGFATVKNTAIPAHDIAEKNGCDINTAGVYTLLKIIENLEDTNMVARGGQTLANQMKQRAGELASEFEAALQPDLGNEKVGISETTKTGFLKKVFSLNDEFVSKNLSPGGAADLLAITYFCKMMRDII